MTPETSNGHGVDGQGVNGHSALGDPNAHRPEPIDFSLTETAITAEVREELRVIAARYPQARSALLPMLHLVQSVEGRVTPTGIEVCAEILGISTADVSGVATFYTMYKRRPVGTYHVGVCTTSLCAVLGGDEVLARLQDHLGVGNDEVTDDGIISLEHIECNAACDYAPVMMVNWEFFDEMTPDTAVEVVDRLRAGEDVRSTRGPVVCRWKQAERVLAGFPDGRADEGPSSGERSRLGLKIAAEHGWSAPAVPPRVTEDDTNEHDTLGEEDK
ncbi:MAG: NADH-quinone oxidoreductase subunit NuoE [Propionibacteriaceae bacterium]